ncbi:MAG: chromosome segregation protein SMC [Bacillota bacterium]
MRLTRLEISGFKSFARSTVLEFPQTLTAVVGPNGSGKSNIVDAFRWVLGEQSPSLLRCSRMDELIFSGTTGRRRLNMAQVSACFENDGYHSDLPAEICVTRRLDRDGGSEYLLNGARCRLRDIQELFWDSGLGKGSYAVIGQGEVERIVDASGEDLRTYIEEVAGVTRFRVVLKESGDRMYRGRDRYRRLTDVLSVRREYVTPLKEQAKRARLHRILSSREMNLRRKVLGAEYTSAASSLSRARGQREQASAELASYSKSIEEFKSRSEELRQNLRRIAANEELFEKGCGVLERDSARLSSDLNVLRERMRSVESEIERNRAELKRTSESIGNIDPDRSCDLRRLSLRRDEAKGELAELEEWVRNVDSRSGRDEAILRRAIRREEWLRGRIRETIRAIDDAEEAIRENYSLASRRAQSLEEVRAELGGLGETTDVAEASGYPNIEGIRSEIAGMQSRLAAGQRERERLAKSRERLTSQITSAESRRNTLEGVIGGQRSGIDDDGHNSEREPGHLLLTKFDTPKDLQEAVQAALGDYAIARTVSRQRLTPAAIDGGGRYVVENPPEKMLPPQTEAAWRRARVEWETWLVDRGVGESAAGWLDDLLQIENSGEDERDPLLQRLFSRFLVLEDRKTLVKLLHLVWSERAPISSGLPSLVSLDGYRADLRGAISGCGGGAKGGRIDRVSMAGEIRKLESTIKQMRKEAEQLDPLLLQAGEEIAGLRDQISDRKGELRAAEKAVAGAKREESAIRDRYRNLNRQMRELEEARERASQEARKMERRKADLDERRRRFIRALSALALFRSSREERVGQSTRGREETNSRIGEIREELLSLAEQIASVESYQRRRSEEIARLQKRENELRAQLRRLESKRDELREQMNRLRYLCDGYRKAMARATKGKEEARKARKDTARENEETRVRAAEMEAARSDLKNKLASLEAKERRFEEELNRIKMVARRDHDVAPGDLGAMDPVRSIGRIRRRISALEQRRRSLEPINPMAVAEYRREVANLTAQEGRASDLHDSLEGLERLRAALATKVENRFLGTLEAVSEEFSRTFAELFDGGEGRIRLKSEDGSGYPKLEIQAQPPGKKLSRMSLLSGGERALTGIVFLFALLKVRPAPVCLLDEIDAALDERNTDRLARYLHDSNGGVQYILITHQKRTMETAEALHGVTMSEPGVSELVSVRLEDAELAPSAAGYDNDN